MNWQRYAERGEALAKFCSICKMAVKGSQHVTDTFIIGDFSSVSYQSHRFDCLLLSIDHRRARSGKILQHAYTSLHNVINYHPVQIGQRPLSLSTASLVPESNDAVCLSGISRLLIVISRLPSFIRLVAAKKIPHFTDILDLESKSELSSLFSMKAY
ncbi:unnamed protein product [Peronospora belbahrii]|uniref:Uncharacterized protein n=1 Tax=Peronospora belbahrii TaxID=622444 RepID=A0ABN8D378_9STRA|nr:unnamed protein product [Peronospora belbahrii]